jgi:hypothetical protein
MPAKKNNKFKSNNGATLGIENELWEVANKLVDISTRQNISWLCWD